MDNLHDVALKSSCYQPQLEELFEELMGLANAFLSDPLDLPETDLDYKLANDVAIGMLDRIRSRLVDGEWPT